MRKAETQHKQVPNRLVVRQGRGVSLKSPQAKQIARLEAMANNSAQAVAQRKTIDAIHSGPNVMAQLEEASAVRPNNTGLPDNLKSGIESLSGISMDNVKVHYNLSRPAQLNALAYAQGADIHVAPGQEQHLPHEAWHVVQQAQGRVLPTMQMKEGVPVNNDNSLEHEADVMGAKAASIGNAQRKSIESGHVDTTLGTIRSVGLPALQMAKDAVDIPGLGQYFDYESIINWDGSEGVVGGVLFEINNSIPSMEARWYYDAHGDQHMRVQYNVNAVGSMTPSARYYVILHELSHLHYQHPGISHPESAENELQADDTALVNAITLNPFEADFISQNAFDLFNVLISQGDTGGGPYPTTTARRDRVLALYNLILDHAQVRLNIKSHIVGMAELYNFVGNHGHALLLDWGCIKPFGSRNGQLGSISEFGFVNCKGVVTFRQFLQWIPVFNAHKDDLPNFEYTYNWAVLPSQVQNNYKDLLPG